MYAEHKLFAYSVTHNLNVFDILVLLLTEFVCDKIT